MAENLATEMAAWMTETSLLPLHDGHYRSSAKGQLITGRTEQVDPSKRYQTLLLSCSLSFSLFVYNLFSSLSVIKIIFNFNTKYSAEYWRVK